MLVRRGPIAIRRMAFSLAELMIALVILGIGLLFIAAALPVGVEYAKRNVDRAAAEAAGVYAANTIEQYVRTSRLLVDSAYLQFNVTPVPRTDAIFRPRWLPPGASVDPLNFVPRVDLSDPDPANWIDYEPLIKVRPFVMRNISFDGATRHIVDACENVIEAYIATLGISLSAADAPGELDANPFSVELLLWQNP
ncbi:MAG: type II secretion system protein, partial [Planctomycetota bacterium]